jgi:hypothetical protein
MKPFVLAGSVLMLSGVWALSAPTAQAKSALTCTAGSVTANPFAGGDSVAYSECLGPIRGNDVNSSINDDLTAFRDSYLGDWSLDAKYEGGSVTAGDNNFAFSWNETSEGAGTWSVN